MDLADWIVAKDNPLTARVFVNRLWAMFHGRGLATPLMTSARKAPRPRTPHCSIGWPLSSWKTAGT